jgi:uncharacterized membrane protein
MTDSEFNSPSGKSAEASNLAELSGGGCMSSVKSSFKGSLFFLCFVALAALFVWHTGQALPERVASHFDGSGTANGFMPRTIYLRFMLALVVGLPVVTTWATGASLNKPGARINLPNRDYWLAPERREQTLASLRAGMRWFAVLLMMFLGYAHWLVVKANLAEPVTLNNSRFVTGLVIFMMAMLIWMKLFLGRFRHRR